MYVAELLAEKGTDVVSINLDDDLNSVARVLSGKCAGVAVVRTRDGRLAGLVSERDIVRAMAERGKDALETPASEVMTRKVLACNMTDTMAGVARLMARHGIRHMPVLDHDQILGMVSIRDFAMLSDDEISATRRNSEAIAVA